MTSTTGAVGAAAKALSAWHGVAAWFLILVLAIVNGGWREGVLIPALGLEAGTSLSGVLLTMIVLAVTALLLRWRRARNVRQAWWLGAGWLLATTAFEMGFGRIIQGRSWQELLDAYTFRHGNLWPVVLLALLFAPPLFAWRRRRVQDSSAFRQYS